MNLRWLGMVLALALLAGVLAFLIADRLGGDDARAGIDGDTTRGEHVASTTGTTASAAQDYVQFADGLGEGRLEASTTEPTYVADGLRKLAGALGAPRPRKSRPAGRPSRHGRAPPAQSGCSGDHPRRANCPHRSRCRDWDDATRRCRHTAPIGRSGEHRSTGGQPAGHAAQLFSSGGGGDRTHQRRAAISKERVMTSQHPAG